MSSKHILTQWVNKDSSQESIIDELTSKLLKYESLLKIILECPNFRAKVTEELIRQGAGLLTASNSQTKEELLNDLTKF